MNAPYRFQLKRASGWSKPPGGIACGRPSRWSNPYIVGQPLPDRAFVAGVELDLAAGERLNYPTAVRLFVNDLLAGPSRGLVAVSTDDVREHLAGHPLGCWCPAEARCHVEPIFRIANGLTAADPVPFREGPPW